MARRTGWGLYVLLRSSSLRPANHLSSPTASIIAKVTRDALMDEYHDRYPEYGFDQHRGYGTPRHMRALEVHGPCAIHRRRFAPIRALWEAEAAFDGTGRASAPDPESAIA